MKFTQTSKLLDAEKFIIFIKWFYKTSLIFRCKFQILILILYPHLSVNLLKTLIKLTKFILEF